MSDSELTRRKFIQASAALTFVVVLEPFGCKRKVTSDPKASTSAVEQPAADSGARQQVGAWVELHEDGTVVIYNPAAEMGQGSMTALAALVADEMDADWEKVRVEHSPVDPAVYGRSWGRSTGGGTMMTVGSHTVPGYYRKLRLAGAQIRKGLLAGASAAMKLPVDELSTEPGAVVHSSGKRITYGELAALDTVPAELPEVTDADLKPKSELRLVGATAARTDVPSKTDGSAQFSIDVQLPGMLYAMIVRSPVPNGSVSGHNAAVVGALPGVETTVELEHGVGIIAASMEELFAARTKLDVEWADGATAAGFDSDEALAGYPAKLASVAPRSLGAIGDAAGARTKATKTFEADYYADHVYHAQMEPLNAVAHVHESGDAEVWLGTQSPGRARSAVARALAITEEQVTLHRYFLGGGFGRRSDADYVVEAVLLAKQVKKPVKLIWTREDDVQYGKFRPMCLQRMSAGVDTAGKLTSWTHQLVGEGGHLLGSGADIAYYDVPNQSIDLHELDHGLRLHYWRAVGHGYNKFAIEAFIDEIAADLGVDPIEYRLRMVSDPRMRRTLELVAEMSSGDEVPEGRARGVAIGERSDSMAAGVAEVSVDESTGELRVHKFWAALDAGIIVQPDNAVAQIEGSIVMGLGTVLTERITLKDGRVQQSNFHDYQLLRMSQTPEIEVRFVESDEPPTGVGEPGVPIVPGAVANAFARLTGKRLRHLPFTPERVKAVL